MEHIKQSSTDKYLQITSHQTKNVNEPLRNGEFVRDPLWVRFEIDKDYFDMQNYQFTEFYLKQYFEHLDINGILLPMEDSISETGRETRVYMISTKASIPVLNNNINEFLETL